MSEAQEGSNEVCRGRSSKGDKTRRGWTTKEEEVLMASLKELVVQGWKADNGFRAGYLNKLEEALRKEFPDTDLKGMPHINSKISAWKKSYGSLSGMLGFSGVGFNLKGTHMIDCNNEQWEQIVKRDRNARLMRFKSWPMLDDWKEVFGKDRATGVNADDVMEAVHKMYQADNIVNGGVDGSNHIQTEEEIVVDDAEDSVCQGGKNEATRKDSNKKRKARDELHGVYAMIGEMSRNTGQRLDNFATRVGYEFDLGLARQTVFDELGKIPGLTINQKFDVCEILADKVQRLEIFIGLPAEAKAQYVERLLQTINNGA